MDTQYGGFQTNYNKKGKRSDITEKSFLSQTRCIFTISHAVRMGFDWPNHEDVLKQGIDFLFEHYRDNEYGGYFWMVDEDGAVIDDNKIIYGHAYLIYALSEYALLTGNEECKVEAIRIFDFLQNDIYDFENGGYFEHYNRRFNLKEARNDIGSFKSLDVHMHLMEAFTSLAELTQQENHKKALNSINELIFEKMIRKSTGTGISMFKTDWTPIANVELDTVWGADRFEEDKSIGITSYGHNIELAWLYLHSQNILGIPKEKSLNKMLLIFNHTYNHGVDWKYGGVFVEGIHDRSVTETNKEFWQQAEGMVGFLDAYLLTSNEKYLDAFKNIHDFVFTKMINWDQGEWYPLLNQKGDVLWDYMGTSWKTIYHTVRAMCQTVNKLEKILN
ncbi:MAG: AGE family epimerase/isomerase [Candidatus Marinimicrobia bacterium]|nr:AGE family epimerase/isomerase [Candidatus Neomarinimicrobiota bacterium]